MKSEQELIVHEAKDIRPAQTEKKQKTPVEILTRTGAEIEHKQKEYLYKPYFPMRKYTVLTADPGTGKTKFVCALAARVTKGDNLCGIPCQHPGNVVLFSREDDADDLVTTVKSCDGDISKLTVIAEDDEALDYMSKKPLFFNSPEIEAIIKEKKPSLVVFDPMQKYTPPNVDTYRNNQTSPICNAILKLATKYKCSIIIITHNVKNKTGLKLQELVNGSSDIVGEARSALAVVQNPESDEKGNNYIIHVKSNNKIGKTIHYKIKSIEGDEDFATVEFVGLKNFYEADYIRMARRNNGTSGEKIDDENPYVKTILKLMKENPRGFRVDKETLQDSIYEYMGLTVAVKLADIINVYRDYLCKKHGIGMHEKVSTVTEIIRNGKIIKSPQKSTRVLQIRKDKKPPENDYAE